MRMSAPLAFGAVAGQDWLQVLVAMPPMAVQGVPTPPFAVRDAGPGPGPWWYSVAADGQLCRRVQMPCAPVVLKLPDKYALLSTCLRVNCVTACWKFQRKMWCCLCASPPFMYFYSGAQGVELALSGRFLVTSEQDRWRNGHVGVWDWWNRSCLFYFSQEGGFSCPRLHPMCDSWLCGISNTRVLDQLSLDGGQVTWWNLSGGTDRQLVDESDTESDCLPQWMSWWTVAQSAVSVSSLDSSSDSDSALSV